MSVEALHTAEIPVENLGDIAQFITNQQFNVPGQNQVIQGTNGQTSILQVQDAINSGALIQVSEGALSAPLVQVDQSQGVYITEGLPNGIQILDGTFPFVPSSDGTSIIQLAPSVVSGTGTEGLTQVVQLANGQFALIEQQQQENVDPQQVQHFVLETIQPGNHLDGEIQQQQQQQMLMEAVAPSHDIKKDPMIEITRPPIGKGPFTCEICEKVLEKWNQYQKHLRTHEDDKPFRCIHCPASYNIANNLKLHLATHIEDGDKPTCPECGKKFSRIASLKAHIMLHEKEETLMCHECGDEFSLQSQLDRHMIEHKEDHEGSRIYPCRQCNAEFTSQKQLKEHAKLHVKLKHTLTQKSHSKDIDRSGFSQKCPHCSKTFQKPSQLQRHVRVHTGDRPYKCPICNKAFNQKGSMQIHMLGRHTDKKPYKCQFCGVGFSQRGNVRAHIRRVHSVESNTEERFPCSECSCVFKKLGSLNAHISRFHSNPDSEDKVTEDEKKKSSGEKEETAKDVIQQLLELSATNNQDQQNQPQESETTDDILKQALENSGVPGGEDVDKSGDKGGTMSVMNVRDTATGVIRKHYVRRLGNQSWHQCSFCSKEFKKPSDLVRHIRIHSHEKPYKCTQCFRAFAVKSTLNSHIKTHTGIKHYKCNVCEKNFSTHGSLKVHIRLHTGLKPFECTHCDKKFRTTAHLKSHMAGHTKSNSRDKTIGGTKRYRNLDLPDVPMQEPILITDTGLIQQPPKGSVFNQYLGESGSVDRPYKCGYCQRGFKKSSHLKQHIRSHTGEKPYKCLTCGKTFVSNGVLKAHIRIHTGLKQYKCLMCENTFSTNGSLKRHMSTHSEVRPFMCPYCQRTFKTNVNCKKHMRTHRQEIAMQTLTEQAALTQTIDEPEDGGEITTQEPAEYVEEEQVDNDLILVQQDLNQATVMSQSEISQQTILNPTTLQDTFGMANTIDQQLLNQQMFGQQQTFTQSLLSASPGFQITNQVQGLGQQQNQFTIQHPQQVNQLDLNTFTPAQVQIQSVTEAQTAVQSVQGVDQLQTITNTDDVVQTVHLGNTDMPSTSMQNILQTSTQADEEEEDIVQEEEVMEEDTQQTEEKERKYPCQECDKTYKKLSHLKQHMRSHTGEKPYKCSKCDKRFVSMGVARQHLRTHSGVKEYRCAVCNAMFTTNGSLSRHMNIHMALKEYKCPFCLEGFRTPSLCKRHMKTHTETKHSDNEDDQQDTNKEDLAESQRKDERRRVVRFRPMPTRPRIITDDTAMSEQLYTESASEKDRISQVKDGSVHVEQKHAHQCEHCPKSFKKPSDLVRHVRIHTGEKPYSCPVCARTFTVKSTLDSHMKTHGSFEKSIRCHVCNSLFSTKGSLKVHMRLHTGSKPFHCPHCPQRFRTSGHRKSHILAHYKPASTGSRKRKGNQAIATVVEEVPAEQALDFINTVDNTGAQTIINPAQLSQVINMDQSMLQGANVLPLSVTVDNFGNLTDNGLAAQVLQGIEGLQVQLAGGNLSQGIQITGLDPSMFNQTVQIDTNLLQQLQAGNVNIGLNQLQTADPNLIQNISSIPNIQVQPFPIQDGMNSNIVVQPLSVVDQTGTQATLQQQVGVGHDVTVNNFTTDTINPQQVQIQQQTVNTELAGDIVVHEQTMDPDQLDVVETSNVEVKVDQDISVTDDIHNVDVTNDIDTDMRAINPNNMTGNIEEISASMMEGDATLPSDEDGLCDDDADEHDDIIHGTVDDDMHVNLDDDSLAGTLVPTTQQATKDDRRYVCSIVHCRKAFKRASHLKEHIRTHSNNPPRNQKPPEHQCPYCTRCFHKPSQMDRHIRIHTGERPFVCGICNKAFNQKNALQMHLKKHSGERPHQCQYCNMSFTQKGNLKTHVKRAHHAEMVDSMNLAARKNNKDKTDSSQMEVTVTQAGKYVEGDVGVVHTDSTVQIVNQDLNLVDVADLFPN